MKKLQLDFAPTGLDGKPITDKGTPTVAIMLARVLSAQELNGDPMKSMEIARNLYKKGFVEVDRSDLENLRDYVKDHKMLSSLWKEQILVVISDLKDQKEIKSDGK